MRRCMAAGLLVALAGCGTSSKAGGAAALVAWGMAGSAVSRANGGCYAVRDARQVCNPESGAPVAP